MTIQAVVRVIHSTALMDRRQTPCYACNCQFYTKVLALDESARVYAPTSARSSMIYVMSSAGVQHHSLQVRFVWNLATQLRDPALTPTLQRSTTVRDPGRSATSRAQGEAGQGQTGRAGGIRL